MNGYVSLSERTRASFDKYILFNKGRWGAKCPPLSIGVAIYNRTKYGAKNVW